MQNCDWVAILMATLVGLAAVGVLQFLIGVAVGSGPVARWAVLLPVFAIATMLISALVWTYLEARRQPDDVRPYIVALVVATITAGVAIEAFAALHLLLWRHGTVSAPGATPGLWRVERLYVWQLVNAVPLLSVPNTLGWSRPRIFTDHLSGVFLLTFKLVVLVPLVQLMVSGFRFAQKWVDDELKEQHRFALPLSVSGDGWRLVGVSLGLLALAVGGAVVLLFLSDSASPLNEWLVRSVPAELAVMGHNVPTEWVRICPAAMGVLIALALVMLAMGTAFNAWEDDPPWSSRTLPHSVALVTSTGLFLVLVTEVIVSLGAVLLRAGAAHAEPPLAHGGEVHAALGFNIWQLLNGVPGLDIPATLNWRLAHPLTDPWSGVLLLGFKVATISAVAVLTSLAVRPHLRRRHAKEHHDADVVP
jgi:hypothetical protein